MLEKLKLAMLFNLTKKYNLKIAFKSISSLRYLWEKLIPSHEQTLKAIVNNDRVSRIVMQTSVAIFASSKDW